MPNEIDRPHGRAVWALGFLLVPIAPLLVGSWDVKSLERLRMGYYFVGGATQVALAVGVLINYLMITLPAWALPAAAATALLWIFDGMITNLLVIPQRKRLKFSGK